MKNIKVALFTVGYRYPGSVNEPIVAGSLNGPYYLSKSLKDNGVNVHVFSYGNKNDKNVSYLNKIKIHRYKKSKLKSIFKFLIEDYRCYKVFKNAYKTEKFNIIQTQDALLFITLFSKIKKIPIIFTDHGSPKNCLEDIPKKGRWIKKITTKLYNQPLYNFIVKKANVVLLISKELYNNSEEELGISIPKTKMKLIHNGVDSNHFRPLNINNIRNKITNNKNIIIYVGRISREKGIHLILDAMPDIIKKYPKTTLLIIGSPVSQHKNYTETLKNIINKNGLENHVNFYIDVPEIKLPKYYSLGDIQIVPSVGYDPMPNVLFEGMSCGLPIISTDFKCRHEIINKNTGFFFKENNVDGLKKCILNGFANKKKLKIMGENARKNMIKNYDIGITVKKYIKIYKSCIEGNMYG